LAAALADGSEVYRVIDTTLIPAMCGSGPVGRARSPVR